MDPISAAGIGLAVVPLVIQVFAGCIKGLRDKLHNFDRPNLEQAISFLPKSRICPMPINTFECACG